MGQCYGKNVSVAGDDSAADAAGHLPPSTSSAAATPAWPSPFPAGVSPSPARSTPRRFFKRPFPPPSPAKHIKASLAKRQGPTKPSILEEENNNNGNDGVGGDNNGGGEGLLDKRFGYGKNFGAKYEVVKEVGRGHLGHTCSARAKNGEMKGEIVAVKIISKAKLEPLAYRRMDFEEFCAAAISPYQLEALEGWEQIASTAFEQFEREANRIISVEELGQEMNLGPAAYPMV